MIGIYKITSPTNRVYIGQSINIKDRLRFYKNLKCKGQPKIYRSLVKYGPKNHKFEIIEECLRHDLDLKETYYKQLELSKVRGNWKNVLFCDLYDRGSGIRSEATKLKMRKPKPKDFGKNHSKIMKGKRKPPRTQEHKDKLRISNLHICRSINQYEVTNKFIRNFNSIKEASDILNIKVRGIINVMKGRAKTAGGFKWKYNN